MKKLLLLSLFLAGAAHGAVYVNTFDSPSALNGFTIYGEQFPFYHPPPLHTVSVTNGQLVIETTYVQPNLPTNSNPVLTGSAAVSLNTSSWGSGFNPTLAQNAGLISWSFNVANQDGPFNNSFVVVLASTGPDPLDFGEAGYALRGGGFVGNTMTLTRFDVGLGGASQSLITFDGLGTLPEKGSFRVVYNPANDQWSLFGAVGSSYEDATLVNTLLGTATDGRYTHQLTPYFVLGGSVTGTDYFDNVVVDIPEPGPGLLGVALCTLACGIRAKRSEKRRQVTT